LLVLIAGGGISGLALPEKNPSKKLQQRLLTLLWIETSTVYFGLYHLFLVNFSIHPMRMRFSDLSVLWQANAC
jgi:hypothetical protein